ncbi:MAG TPA: hypothetical protein PKN54_00390 [Candidatus Cloacimonas acidaminovorans]|nr:hypothetical protein [Candidatus Cloacimonas acidaminovorans]
MNLDNHIAILLVSFVGSHVMSHNSGNVLIQNNASQTLRIGINHNVPHKNQAIISHITSLSISFHLLTLTIVSINVAAALAHASIILGPAIHDGISEINSEYLGSYHGAI